MSPADKPLVWLHSEVRSPPFTVAARLEAGYLLRLLQAGATLSMPHSRPMPGIAQRCHELRIPDERVTWRIVYRVEPDAIVVLHVFDKKTSQTPKHIIGLCKSRLREYQHASS